ADVPLQSIAGLVFGGQEVRRGTLLEAAREIYQQTGTIPYPLLEKLKSDLAAANRNIRPGTLINAGKTITKLASGGNGPNGHDVTLRQEVDRLRGDIRSFMRRNKLKRCICINLTSTEPQLRITKSHGSLQEFDRSLDADRRSTIRPSSLYAYAAASLGLPFIHFTPSNAALVPAIQELFWQGRGNQAGNALADTVVVKN
ncbi:MAG: inositol-3-phosphate synthase, partial [Planctomycetota bacterium]